MNRHAVEDAIFPGCPIRNVLDRLCDKWSLLVIYTLNKTESQKLRFKQLQREIPDISQKMLTATLRTLEEPVVGSFADVLAKVSSTGRRLLTQPAAFFFSGRAGDTKMY